MFVCLSHRTRQLSLKLSIKLSHPIYEALDKQPFDTSNFNCLWSDSNPFKKDS